MNTESTNHDAANQPSGFKKHLRNAALLIVGIVVAYLVTSFLR